MQICTFCNIEKPFTDFPKDPSRKTGYQTRCFSCKRILNNLKQQIKILNILEKEQYFLKLYYDPLYLKFTTRQWGMIFSCLSSDIYLMLKKFDINRCSKCLQIKSFSKDFFNTTYEAHGKMFLCKSCCNLRENSEIKLNRSRKWRIENREKSRKHARDHYWKYRFKMNKDKEYKRIWIKHRRTVDENFRFKCNTHTYVWRCLKKYINGDPVIWKLPVSYTFHELILHLEKQFDENMNWKNYGKYWQLDHIIPQSQFNLLDENEFQKCWSLENLRPLFWQDNLKKYNH